MTRGAPTMYELVLASTSPRRRLLLDQHGYAHSVMSPGVDDGVLERGDVTPAAWAAALAHLKASAAAAKLRDRGETLEGKLLLAADTVVVKGGRVIGQPSDESEAAETIGVLSGGSHDVVTAVALASDRGVEWLVDTARVTVGKIDEERVAAYVATGGWEGKAGGYNLGERIGDGWPITFEGDATSIMGLPMARLGSVLDERLGVETPGRAERR